MSSGENFMVWASNVAGAQGPKTKSEQLYSYLGDRIYEQELIIKKTNKILKRNEVKVASRDLNAFLDGGNPNLDKLSGKDRKKYEDWISQLEYSEKKLQRWADKGISSDASFFKREMKNVKELKSLIAGLFPEEDKSKQTTLLKSSNLGSSTRLLPDTADITGDTRVAKNLTINIDNMIEGGLNIISQTLNEGTAEMKQKVLEALLSAVNDINGA